MPRSFRSLLRRAKRPTLLKTTRLDDLLPRFSISAKIFLRSSTFLFFAPTTPQNKKRRLLFSSPRKQASFVAKIVKVLSFHRRLRKISAVRRRKISEKSETLFPNESKLRIILTSVANRLNAAPPTRRYPARLSYLAPLSIPWPFDSFILILETSLFVSVFNACFTRSPR